MDGRDYLRLVPLSELPFAEHAWCPPPCRGLMAPDATTGLLVCQDCGMAALDATEILGKAVRR